MQYVSGAAFRMALETRLRTESLSSGLPLVRLRKTVAFDRLLARMIAFSPDGWLLKGGFALQLRMDSQSRTTKDIDLLLLEECTSSHAFVVMAARIDLRDWFEFEVAAPSTLPMHGGVRMSVRALLDGRDFESFHIDVGLDDPVTDIPDRLPVTMLLEFADIAATVVPCYPLVQHVAEKMHALTRSYGMRENSRVKDLVDLVVMAERYEFDAVALGAAMQATFYARASHAVPAGLPEFPAAWAPEYRRMSRAVAAEAEDLASATVRLRAFLDPVLRGTAEGSWLPSRGIWGR